MDFSRRHHQKDKIVVIVGATGSGKSKLSVDLATIFPAEIINSDKMQVYHGLDITTNQISTADRNGVPHHLLGNLHPHPDVEFSAADFRSAASRAIAGIVSRGKLPVLAGGSNSFVHALLAERFDPDNSDPFSVPGSITTELRYSCCFLWVDVSLPVLFEYLSKRVDEMLEAGMYEELADFYDPVSDPGESGNRVGLWKAIGVPEFDRFFRKYPPGKGNKNTKEWDSVRKGAYEKAVREMKENTCQLAKTQLEKIMRLKGAGWDIKRLDATAAFRAKLMETQTPPEEEGEWSDVWEREVLEPSVKIVKRFLEE